METTLDVLSATPTPASPSVVKDLAGVVTAEQAQAAVDAARAAPASDVSTDPAALLARIERLESFCRDCADLMSVYWREPVAALLARAGL